MGNIIVVAKRGGFNGCSQRRVIQRMWPEEGNITNMARRGEHLTDLARSGSYNCCVQKRGILTDVAIESNIKYMAKKPENG